MSTHPIHQKIASLPQAPGVYLMKDAKGEVFYVGKAKSLRDRVRSYFSGSDTRAFVARLDELLADIEVILTHTDKEAFILENELIKKHRPRFNVRLIDDKNFLSLKLDLRQPYPRLEVVRRMSRGAGIKFFGPYHSATSIREALRIVNRHFQLRTCSDHVLNTRARPCLQYQIKRCPAPCVFDLSHGEYARNVENVTAFLEGRQQELINALRTRMQEKSTELEFEAAAALRDQINAIEHSLERQRMVTRDLVNRDVIGVYREGPAVEIHILRVRQGRLSDAGRFSFSDIELPTANMLSDFTARYYTESDDIPNEILLPLSDDFEESLAAWLSERAGHVVRVATPARGDKKRLVDLAARNAQQAFIDKQRQAGAARTSVERLQRALHLRKLPERIECYDISHIQGNQIVASGVRFEQGVPKKELYRHYKIRTTVGQDDFQSMYEVLHRRARRGLEEGDLPDLIIIDGGKGQLNAARAALEDHGIDEVDLISLAKSRVIEDAASDDKAPERSPERVFVLGSKNPIVLRQNSAELFLLARARDEAHRFAITFHRKLRGKAATRSVLDSIEGVGPKRRRALLKHFGSLARVRGASVEEISRVVGKGVAEKIFSALKQGEGED